MGRSKQLEARIQFTNFGLFDTSGKCLDEDFTDTSLGGIFKMFCSKCGKPVTAYQYENGKLEDNNGDNADDPIYFLQHKICI